MPVPPADVQQRPSKLLAVARRIIPAVLTVAVFAFIFQRVPFARLVTTLRDADYVTFLAWMIPNAILYFCWDTLVLTVAIRWFHGPIRFRELLPARAVLYVVSLFNTNLARGALAGYLARRLHHPFLQLGSTVIFLLLTEYTHLVGWATLGLMLAAPKAAWELLLVAPAIALFWFVFLLFTRLNTRQWSLLRTFRIAPPRRYAQTVALRAPMFFASLVFHYFAASAFGIHIPFLQMVAFLPVIFMIAALPITVAHLGTTQVAWLFFFGNWAPAENLMAFSLAAHATFTVCRALIGVLFMPSAYAAIVRPDRDRTGRLKNLDNASLPSSAR
jgi:hypothetical protein